MIVAVLFQAAVETVQQAAQATAGATGDNTEVVPYLTSAALIVYVQRWLKSRDFYQAFVGAMPGADKWAHRLVAGVGALLMALGIHYTFTGDMQAGWQLHLSIPALWTLLHTAGDFVKEYVLQQMIFDGTKDKVVIV